MAKTRKSKTNRKAQNGIDKALPETDMSDRPRESTAPRLPAYPPILPSPASMGRVSYAVGPVRDLKRDRMVGSLSTPDGMELHALSAELGWLTHTTRAAITRLRQAGCVVTGAKTSGGVSGSAKSTPYRIVGWREPAPAVPPPPVPPPAPETPAFGLGGDLD